jgi:hypothetical protein
MKVKVSVKPIELVGKSMSIPFSYSWKGTVRILMENGEMTVHRGDAVSTPLSKSRIFNENFKSIDYEYEDGQGETKQTETDKKIQNAVDVFWSNHPLTLVNGKRHANSLPKVLFDVEVQTTKIMNAAKDLKSKGMVFNRINSMTLAEKRDVAYYYGESPKGKSDLDLLTLLADFNAGICMGENMESFLQIWSKPNEDTQRQVIIRKALDLNIIYNKADGEKNNYYHGTTFIGTAFNDIVSYCTREENVYKNHILREVQEKDNFVSESQETNQEKVNLSSTGSTTSQNVNTLQALREEAKLLKKEGFMELAVRAHVMGEDTLRPIVEESRKKKAKEMVAA